MKNHKAVQLLRGVKSYEVVFRGLDSFCGFCLLSGREVEKIEVET